jgi:CheY-like chemotaxis protein
MAAGGSKQAVKPMTKKVLVVDDEPNIVMSLRFLMEREGYQVEVAPTGEAALGALGREPADLVLLDVMMPEVDGFEVCQRIRTNPAWGATKVVMLTA